MDKGQFLVVVGASLLKKQVHISCVGLASPEREVRRARRAREEKKQSISPKINPAIGANLSASGKALGSDSSARHARAPSKHRVVIGYELVLHSSILLGRACRPQFKGGGWANVVTRARKS